MALPKPDAEGGFVVPAWIWGFQSASPEVQATKMATARSRAGLRATKAERAKWRVVHCWVLCAACLLAGLGCRQLARIGECRQFVALANATVLELSKLDPGNEGTPTPDAYHRLALRFERAQAEFEALPLEDKELKQAVAQVTATMATAAEQSRAYEKELLALQAAKDLRNPRRKQVALNELKKAHATMLRTVRAYRSTVARVNALCQPAK